MGRSAQHTRNLADQHPVGVFSKGQPRLQAKSRSRRNKVFSRGAAGGALGRRLVEPGGSVVPGANTWHARNHSATAA